jgi:hypothetical protein
VAEVAVHGRLRHPHHLFGLGARLVANRDLVAALAAVLAGAFARSSLGLGIGCPESEDPGDRPEPQALQRRPSVAGHGQPASDLVEIVTFHGFDLLFCFCHERRGDTRRRESPCGSLVPSKSLP